MSLFNKSSFTDIIEVKENEGKKIVFPDFVEKYIVEQIDSISDSYTKDNGVSRGTIGFLTENNNLIKSSLSASKVEDEFYQTILNQVIKDHNSSNPKDEIKFFIRVGVGFIKVSKADNLEKALNETEDSQDKIKKLVIEKLDSLDPSSIDKESFKAEIKNALSEVVTDMGFKHNLVVEIESKESTVLRTYDIIETKIGKEFYAAISRKPETEEKIPTEKNKFL